MKKKQLITSLAATGIMMTSMVGNVFADSSSNAGSSIHHPEQVDQSQITSSEEILTIDTENTVDKFRIKINKIGKSPTGKYSGYTINEKIANNKIYFTVTTDKGSSLGNLDNSQNRLDSKRVLEDGKIEYKFHYTFFNYSPVRVININVTPIVEENVVPTASVEETTDSVVQ